MVSCWMDSCLTVPFSQSSPTQEVDQTSRQQFWPSGPFRHLRPLALACKSIIHHTWYTVIFVTFKHKNIFTKFLKSSIPLGSTDALPASVKPLLTIRHSPFDLPSHWRRNYMNHSHTSLHNKATCWKRPKPTQTQKRSGSRAPRILDPCSYHHKMQEHRARLLAALRAYCMMAHACTPGCCVLASALVPRVRVSMCVHMR